MLTGSTATASSLARRMITVAAATPASSCLATNCAGASSGERRTRRKRSPRRPTAPVANAASAAAADPKSTRRTSVGGWPRTAHASPHQIVADGRQQQPGTDQRRAGECAIIDSGGTTIERRPDEEQQRQTDRHDHRRLDVTSQIGTSSTNILEADRRFSQRVARRRAQDECAGPRFIAGALPSHAQRDGGQRRLQGVIGRRQRRCRPASREDVFRSDSTHPSAIGIEERLHVDEPQADRRRGDEERRRAAAAIGGGRNV